MNDSGNPNTLSGMLMMPRFGPAWFSAFLLGLSLLFIDKLPSLVQEFMIPSLLVYSLGAGFLGSFHRMLAIDHMEYTIKKDDSGKEYPVAEKNDEQTIPLIWKVSLLIVHILWLGLFVGYNFCRVVL